MSEIDPKIRITVVYDFDQSDVYEATMNTHDVETTNAGRTLRVALLNEDRSPYAVTMYRNWDRVQTVILR